MVTSAAPVITVNAQKPEKEEEEDEDSEEDEDDWEEVEGKCGESFKKTVFNMIPIIFLIVDSLNLNHNLIVFYFNSSVVLYKAKIKKMIC